MMKWLSFATVILLFIFGVVIMSPWYHKQRAIEEVTTRLNNQQQVIVDAANTHSSIDGRLNVLLHDVPSANHAIVSIIQSSESATDDSDPLARTTTIKSTTTNTVTSMNEPSETISVSMGVLRDFMPEMLAHKCKYVPVAKISDQIARAKISDYAHSFLMCPIFSVNNDLLGAVFLTWHQIKDVPCIKKCSSHEQTMANVADLTKKASADIGQWVALDLKTN